MIIKPWLCFQWPWNYTDNKNVKRIILTAIGKYEKEEKNKKHFIRGESPIESIDNDNDNNKESLLKNIENSQNIENEEEDDKEEDFSKNKNKRKKDNNNYVELKDLPKGK